MLEISYTLNLGQLLKIVLKLKRYLWHKLKLNKFHNPSRPNTKKQVNFLIPEVGTSIIIINNYMVVIQVQIGKNIIKYVLLDGGSRVNIITK
jgi:hypothetical protein